MADDPGAPPPSRPSGGGFEPATIEQYRIESVVARGGVGTVCRATDTTLDRIVAIKMILGRFLAAPGFVDRLRAEAAALEGKRGGKTAAKRAQDEERRQRRRLVTEGWSHVLDGMAAVHADVLAVSIGAGDTMRHMDRADAIRALAHPERSVEVEHALSEIQRARSGLRLNPLADLWVEGLLDRLAMLRRGQLPPRRAPGLMVG